MFHCVVSHTNVGMYTVLQHSIRIGFILFYFFNVKFEDCNTHAMYCRLKTFIFSLILWLICRNRDCYAAAVLYCAGDEESDENEFWTFWLSRFKFVEHWLAWKQEQKWKRKWKRNQLNICEFSQNFEDTLKMASGTNPWQNLFRCAWSPMCIFNMNVIEWQ